MSDEKPDPFDPLVEAICAAYNRAVVLYPCPDALATQIDWLAHVMAIFTAQSTTVRDLLSADNVDPAFALITRKSGAAAVLCALLDVDIDVAEMAVDVALRAQAKMPTEGKPH